MAARLAAFAVCIAATGSYAGASGTNPVLWPPPVVIIALPQMSWSRLRSGDMPRTSELAEAMAAIGLMPIASPSDTDPNRTWVTLGAGRAAAGGEITGRALPGGGFQVNIGPIRAANERAYTSAIPGLLGSQLHDRGLTTALIAYQATEHPQVPPSAAIIMDETGRIDGGHIYKPAEISPLGKRLNPEQVRSAVDEELSRHDIVLLDLTGVASLRNADDVIGRVTDIKGAPRGRFCLVTGLTPAYGGNSTRTMGFVISTGLLIHAGKTETVSGDMPSLLSSRSTRWPGVVVPADFARSVLAVHRDELTDSNRAMTGRPMQTLWVRDAPAHLDRLDRMLTDQFILEGQAARLYASYMMLLAAATFALGVWRRAAARWLALPALIGVALPIGLLVCPLAGIGQTKQLVVACLASVVLGLLAFHPGSARRSLAIALVIGAAITLADPLLGSPLMRLAPLGFGAVTGARFYGIGNEYVGVLGATAPIGLGLMLHQSARAKWIAPIIGAFIVLVVGAPWWGANWGGCVSIAAGLLAVWVALAPQRRWRRALIGLCGLLVAAVLPAALDLLRPETARSHIGVAAAALIGGQLDAVRDTAVRKIEMNWRLAQLASWWWLLAPVGLLGIWELVRRSRETWRRAQVAVSVRAGFLGALMTGVVGVVVNDSGVVILGMALAVTFAAHVFLLARSEADVA
jgi:hypothetical protein